MTSNDVTTGMRAELADLRKRRDLREMSSAEIELLASKTAVTLIEAAHAREARAEETATRAIAEAHRRAQEVIAEAEAEARKLVAAARAETASLRQELQAKLGNVDAERERLLEAARREARQVTADAEAKVAQYRAWLRRQVEDARKIHKGLSDRLGAIADVSKGHDEALAKAAAALEELHQSSDPSTP